MDTAQIRTIHSIQNFCSNLHAIFFNHKSCLKQHFEKFYTRNLDNFVKIMSTVLKFHKLSAKAITPAHGSEYAAGLDLFSAEAKTIPSRGRALVKTDIQVALPDGCYGRIAPRSGLAYKKVKLKFFVWIFLIIWS